MSADGATASLFGWFHRTARSRPDAIALEVAAERLSYGQLDELAARLDGAIGRAAGPRPLAVGLLCTRSVAAYAGYLAAQRMGAAAVPLNPAFPPVRNQAICDAAGVGAVIVDDSGAEHADELAARIGAAFVRLPGARWWREWPAVAQLTARHTRPADLAYVLFTSGTTGRPKGVPIRHRQLAEYVPYCARRYAVGPGSRMSQTFDLTFDPSVFDMFVAWFAGATLVVPQPEEILAAARFVQERQISHWFSVPSVISIADRLRGLRGGSMPQLRYSLFAGEQLTLDQAGAWAAAAPSSVIENAYGPTELTITCTSYRLPTRASRWPGTSNGTVPIGRPYPHLEAIVVAENGTEGDVGELCARGSQRFDGYLLPADNEGRFLRQPGQATGPASGGPADADWYRTGDRVGWQHGELVHLGRVDQQVKIGGHRIEPAEIEWVLREHPSIHEAVVVAVPAAASRAELHALYTGMSATERELIEHVRGRLPGYMVPARLRHVRELPVSPNGKIDRARVRQLAAVPAPPD
jgi:amino acid adenylation domain-containing protein